MKRLLLSLILCLSLTTSGYCVDNWTKASPVGTDLAADLDAIIQVNNNALDRFLAYGRHWAKLSFASTTTLTVTLGSAVCSNAGLTIRRLRTNPTSTTVTWADLDAGAEAASTTYYVYAVGDTDAATFTIKISTSSSAPTGITYYLKLGSFYNDASSNIVSVTDDISAAMRYYDSGWFAVSNNTQYVKAHNLGTSRLASFLYYSASADGSSAVLVGKPMGGSRDLYGGSLQDISTTSITAYSGATSISSKLVANVVEIVTSGYYRVVCVALE